MERNTPRSVTRNTARSSEKIAEAKPDAVFNTLNGDSNIAFFKQLKSTGITAEQMPVMSVSVAEEEVKGIGVDNIAGQRGPPDISPAASSSRWPARW
ncbi:ABC-type branched-subunit amino acid transport system substrate-binding protein [Planotetraspora sp. GP83]